MSVPNDPPIPVPISKRRRQRLSAEEVREKMFEAAREVLFLQGVTVSLEDLGMDEVIFRAGVPRSSVYRIWPYKDDFVNDLLIDLAGPSWRGTAAFDEETIKVAIEVVRNNWNRLSTAEGRRAVLLEAVRTGATRNLDGIVDSLEWPIYVALIATSRGANKQSDENSQRLVARLEQAESQFIIFMGDFYAAMSQMLGLRPKEGYTYRQLAAAGAATVEGLALRRVLFEANSDNRASSPTSVLESVVEAKLRHPEDDSHDWSIAAIAFQGILDAFTESDPNWVPANLQPDLVDQVEGSLTGMTNLLREPESIEGQDNR
jgi:AcrR family transcriptional regulator